MFGGKEINGVYDYATFSLPDGTSDYDVKANQAALFSNIPIASKVFIWSTQNISMKFNNSSYAAIPLTVTDGESPYEGKEIFLVSNIYLTNASGSSATIKILLGV